MLQQLMETRKEVLYGVFLDLRKAYYILECKWCLEIMVAYRVGQWKMLPLKTYWERLAMVAQSGR